MLIEEKISLGLTSVQIFTKVDPMELMKYFRSHGGNQYRWCGCDRQDENNLYYHTTAGPAECCGYHQTVPPECILSLVKVKSVAEGVFPKNTPEVLVFFHGSIPCVFTGKENEVLRR